MSSSDHEEEGGGPLGHHPSFSAGYRRVIKRATNQATSLCQFIATLEEEIESSNSFALTPPQRQQCGLRIRPLEQHLATINATADRWKAAIEELSEPDKGNETAYFDHYFEVLVAIEEDTEGADDISPLTLESLRVDIAYYLGQLRVHAENMSSSAISPAGSSVSGSAGEKQAPPEDHQLPQSLSLAVATPPITIEQAFRSAREIVAAYSARAAGRTATTLSPAEVVADHRNAVSLITLIAQIRSMITAWEKIISARPDAQCKVDRISLNQELEELAQSYPAMDESDLSRWTMEECLLDMDFIATELDSSASVQNQARQSNLPTLAEITKNQTVDQCATRPSYPFVDPPAPPTAATVPERKIPSTKKASGDVRSFPTRFSSQNSRPGSPTSADLLVSGQELRDSIFSGLIETRSRNGSPTPSQSVSQCGSVEGNRLNSSENITLSDPLPLSDSCSVRGDASERTKVNLPPTPAVGKERDICPTRTYSVSKTIILSADTKEMASHSTTPLGSLPLVKRIEKSLFSPPFPCTLNAFPATVREEREMLSPAPSVKESKHETGTMTEKEKEQREEKGGYLRDPQRPKSREGLRNEITATGQTMSHEKGYLNSHSVRQQSDSRSLKRSSHSDSPEEDKRVEGERNSVQTCGIRSLTTERSDIPLPREPTMCEGDHEDENTETTVKTIPHISSLLLPLPITVTLRRCYSAPSNVTHSFSLIGTVQRQFPFSPLSSDHLMFRSRSVDESNALSEVSTRGKGKRWKGRNTEEGNEVCKGAMEIGMSATMNAILSNEKIRILSNSIEAALVIRQGVERIDADSPIEQFEAHSQLSMLQNLIHSIDTIVSDWETAIRGLQQQEKSDELAGFDQYFHEILPVTDDIGSHPLEMFFDDMNKCVESLKIHAVGVECSVLRRTVSQSLESSLATDDTPPEDASSRAHLEDSSTSRTLPQNPALTIATCLVTMGFSLECQQKQCSSCKNCNSVSGEINSHPRDHSSSPSSSPINIIQRTWKTVKNWWNKDTITVPIPPNPTAEDLALPVLNSRGCLLCPPSARWSRDIRITEQADKRTRKRKSATTVEHPGKVKAWLFPNPVTLTTESNGQQMGRRSTLLTSPSPVIRLITAGYEWSTKLMGRVSTYWKELFGNVVTPLHILRTTVYLHLLAWLLRFTLARRRRVGQLFNLCLFFLPVSPPQDVPSIKQSSHSTAAVHSASKQRLTPDHSVKVIRQNLRKDPRLQFQFWSHVALDYIELGLYIDGKGRMMEAFILQFTCPKAQATHFEFVENLEAQSFINAFERFTNDRAMMPEVIWIDDSNTIQIDGESFPRDKRYLDLLRDREVKSFLARRLIEWIADGPAQPSEAQLARNLSQFVRRCFYGTFGRGSFPLGPLHRGNLTRLLRLLQATVNNQPIVPLPPILREDPKRNGLNPEEIDGENIPEGFVMPESKGRMDGKKAGRIVMNGHGTLPLKMVNIMTELVYRKTAHARFWKVWNQDYLAKLCKSHLANKRQGRYSASEIFIGMTVLMVKDALKRKFGVIGQISQINLDAMGHVQSIHALTENGSTTGFALVEDLIPLDLEYRENSLLTSNEHEARVILYGVPPAGQQTESKETVTRESYFAPLILLPDPAQDENIPVDYPL